MSWVGRGVIAGVVVLAVLLLAPVLLMVMVMTGAGRSNSGSVCGDSLAAGGSVSSDQLSEAQLRNAATIIAVGTRLRVPRRAIVVALAAAHQESRFLNYANDGRGTDLRPDQAGIASSQELPHQAVGSDHGSLGVFQQQWPWWGSMSELMDPAASASKFYTRLVAVPGWASMSVTSAAQAVQHSAFPDAYADDEAVAESLLAHSGLGSDGSVAAMALSEPVGGAECESTDVVDGPIVTPIASSTRVTDLHNYGNSGGRWSHGHTGTDLSAPCGTPVRAATAGTVVLDTGQAWAGTWLVKVSTGTGRLTTWYAHMQALDVADGELVRAGQLLGEVGNRGNSTGCHLHFEVHPRGGSIYEDGVDPSEWLQTHAGADAPQVQSITAESGPSSSQSGAGSFVLASFNVLGNSHTTAGGDRASWPSGEVRMRQAVQLLDTYGVDVVGLQELQRPQRQVLLEVAGDRYAVYSPPGDTENSIAWRRDRWAFVSADVVPIPYFHGNIRDMPIVRLRDLTTGGDAIFVNVHNPADVHGNAARFRAEAVRRELAVMTALSSQYDVPAFLTGDFNDRAGAFCALTAGGLLSASAGGSHAGRCAPPSRPGIDWIFGTRRSTWTGSSTVWEPRQRRISDHPLVLARVATTAGADR